ncbi:HPP family protein [bacterium]|nr:HPP family protein [bacterium]
MHFFDEKFEKHKLNYVLQCFFAAVSILIVLLILDLVHNAVVIASLGASFFIVFTMPHSRFSGPRCLVGGYIVGILSAFICYNIFSFVMRLNLPVPDWILNDIFLAVTVGLAIFLMVITNTEHPPAASVALGVFYTCCNFKAILVVFIGIVLVSIIKQVLKPVLKNLV